ncbi:MAG: Uncharacterised protein [Prochlorococcus marinus str. MIT 9313]|nr:MAG: Uncharacterised protein [Prochlorococcus marinus str. MIT 9313]
MTEWPQALAPKHNRNTTLLGDHNQDQVVDQALKTRAVLQQAAATKNQTLNLKKCPNALQQ